MLAGELPGDIANLTGSLQCLLNTMFLLNVQPRKLSCTTVTLSYHGLEMQGLPKLVTTSRYRSIHFSRDVLEMRQLLGTCEVDVSDRHFVPNPLSGMSLRVSLHSMAKSELDFREPYRFLRRSLQGHIVRARDASSTTHVC